MTEEEKEFIRKMQTANPDFPEGQIWQFIRNTNLFDSRKPPACSDDSEELHDVEQAHQNGMAMVAMCLGTVAEGKFTSLAAGEKYAELYQFVTGPIYASILGLEAFKVCKDPKLFPGFVYSASLPEFFPQLFNWMRAFNKNWPLPDPSDWKSSLEFAWKEKDSESNHPETLNYVIQKLALPKTNTSKEIYEALAEIIQNAEVRARMAKRRAKKAEELAKKKRQNSQVQGKRGRGNRFKDALMTNWIPAALWCRSSSEILRIIEPRAKLNDRDTIALETDISRLKLRRPPIDRRNLLQREITEAEHHFFKLFGPDFDDL